MRSYVADAWVDFIGKIGEGVADFPQPDPTFEYSYGEGDWSARADREFTVRRASTTIRTRQVAQIVSLIGRSGLNKFTESQLRAVLEQGKADGEFNTIQDVMLVFNFYRKQLRDDGVLDY
jgi:hypothetical protein